MENFEKINEKEFKKIETKTEETIYNLDELVKRRQDRIDYLTSITDDITNEVDDLDVLIAKAKELKVKTSEEIKAEDVVIEKINK